MQIIIQEHLKSEVQKMQHQCENDWQCGYQNALNDVLHIIDSLTPIELPSDEEIKEAVENKFGLVDTILGKSDYRMGYESGLIKGVKWMKDLTKTNNL